ncbi:MAG: DegT/DnrJ/EryC1/StrS family aminotransferase [Thermoleophilia bacterium]
MSDNYVPFARPDIDEADIQAVAETLRSGWITTGPKTHEFEEELRAYLGTDHAVAVNSCTAALHLALEAMQVGPGDEVITSPYTFASSGEVIRYLGATPVFADISSEDLNLDPAQVEAAISPRTKAIMPVHIAGKACDLDALYAVASRHRLSVVEDSAHALPTSYAGKRIGTPPDRARFPELRHHACCFSFYATKTLTTGEGGMLTTDDEAIARQVRMMALHGLSGDAWKRYGRGGSWYYEILQPGYKYNLTDIAAALGLSQLRKLEKMRDQRAVIATRYVDAFQDCPVLQLPVLDEIDAHAIHLFTLRLHLDQLDIDRAAFIEEMRKQGVACSVHFIPLHTHPYYREKYGYHPEDYPVAYQEYQREVSLPIYSSMTTAQVETVCQAVLSICRQHAGKRQTSVQEKVGGAENGAGDL